MRGAAGLLFFVVLGMSNGCEQTIEPAVQVVEPPAPDALPEVVKPGAIYQRAYERAKETITVENAASRLTAIERAIDREGGQGDAGESAGVP